jgi:hypothetical protein
MTLRRHLGDGAKIKKLEGSKHSSINVAWGIWLAKTLKLFEDKETLPLKCVVQSKHSICLSPDSRIRKLYISLKKLK